FVCEVSGIPKPEVTWFLEGIPVRRRDGIVEIYEDGAFHYLCLRRARMRDSGRYSCTASNSLGHVSCSWTLLVDRSDLAQM
ncbi:Myosin light chain kinase, smooth muscle, partial [Lemmus lemmus]